MENFNRFLNEVRRLSITAVEHRYLVNEWVSIKEFPDLPKNLKTSFWWELAPFNENGLKELQSNALTEVMLLTTEQREGCLKRLEIIKSFSDFYDFIGKFYPKYVEGKHDNRDIYDLKTHLDGCFIVDVPDKGNPHEIFLLDLQEQIFIKDGYLEQLKCQIEKLNHKQVDKLEYNPSQFNDYTFGLYNYIIKNYDKKGHIKYINIWYFLKRDCDKTKHPDLMFNFTQEKYKEFAKVEHDIKITKFEKADYDYDDTQKGVLTNLANDYKGI